MLSGRFSKRVRPAKDYLLEHSGLLQCDIDDCAVESLRTDLAKDNFVAAFFLSPTGSGLKAIVRVKADADLHERSFLAAQEHFLQRYGVQIDRACRDVSRLCYVSDDPLISVRNGDTKVLEPAPEPKPKENPEPELSIHEQVVRRCGEPYTLSGHGLNVNQGYFVERFALENKILFEQQENRFHIYNAATGAWEGVPLDCVKNAVKEDFCRLVKEFDEPGLYFKGTSVFYSAVTSTLRGRVGESGIFGRLTADEPGAALLHVRNGMLTIRPDGKNTLSPFSPDYYSRNVFDFDYDPAKPCPKFLAMLAFAFPPETKKEKKASLSDDASLFLRWFGGCLIQGNPAQKVALFTGVPFSSKSVMLTIVESAVGQKNVETLRTHLLHERFELARYTGKVLLTAKDVPGDFLQHKGAQAIKALCGTDRQTAETKGTMEKIPISGDYHIGITSNERLLVRLRGETDAGAWARRLILLHFKHAIPAEKRVENYHEVLLAEEGDGIFALAVSGACKYLADLQEHRAVFMTKEQKERVDALVFESQSLELFVSERITPDENADLSTEEIIGAYARFCRERKWKVVAVKTIERRLADLMLEFFGEQRSTHIERNKKRANGYKHVALK
jgi:phage/plasmid-associated DNA primase